MASDIINIPKLNVESKCVRDLALSSFVLTAIEQTNTISSISSYLQSDALSIIDICSQLQALNDIVDRLSSNNVVCYLNNVSFLKAVANDPTNLCIQFYTSPEMSSVLSVSPETGEASEDGVAVQFDSANLYDRQFIEALLVNNGSNANNDMLDGTQWKTPVDDRGFGEEYNNAPVSFKLVEWALGNEELSCWASRFDKNTKLYIKYAWYYKTGNDMHSSDIYSQVLPTQTEQTAQRPVDAGTSHDENTVNYSLWNESIDDFGKDAYVVKPNCINILDQGLDDSGYSCICLEDYSIANEYKIKFLARSSFMFSSESVGIYASDGSMIDEFEDYSSLQFEQDTTYLIMIQAGMITILAKK